MLRIDWDLNEVHGGWYFMEEPVDDDQLMNEMPAILPDGSITRVGYLRAAGRWVVEDDNPDLMSKFHVVYKYVPEGRIPGLLPGGRRMPRTGGLYEDQ